MQEIASKSLERIQGALANGGKRLAIANEVGISEGQLSKLISGDLRRFCQIAAVLGLEVISTDYVRSVERILKERL
jgi:hypothetical protein